ncbi:hypothetical protein KIL84_004776, partial [Mauremys mutica]
DILGCQGVDALGAALALGREVSHHGVGLAAARLAVGEAGGHAPAEDALHQRLGRVPVHQLVGGALVEGVVEAEGLALQVAAQVQPLPGLVHHHHAPAGDGHHVEVLQPGLPRVERPLADADADPVLGAGLGAAQRPAGQAAPVLLDHADHVVVGVRRGGRLPGSLLPQLPLLPPPPLAQLLQPLHLPHAGRFPAGAAAPRAGSAGLRLPAVPAARLQLGGRRRRLGREALVALGGAGRGGGQVGVEGEGERQLHPLALVGPLLDPLHGEAGAGPVQRRDQRRVDAPIAALDLQRWPEGGNKRSRQTSPTFPGCSLDLSLLHDDFFFLNRRMLGTTAASTVPKSCLNFQASASML